VITSLSPTPSIHSTHILFKFPPFNNTGNIIRSFAEYAFLIRLTTHDSASFPFIEKSHFIGIATAPANDRKRPHVVATVHTTAVVAGATRAVRELWWRLIIGVGEYCASVLERIVDFASLYVVALAAGEVIAGVEVRDA